MLKLGDNNSYVSGLQAILNSKGYSYGNIDNDFGQKTLNAVIK